MTSLSDAPRPALGELARLATEAQKAERAFRDGPAFGMDTAPNCAHAERTREDLAAACTPEVVLQLVALAAGGAAGGHQQEIDNVYPRADYHEDEGPVLWWTVPVQEPPYVGTDLDSDFPDRVTHWSRLHIPEWLLSAAARSLTPERPADV